MIRVTEKGSVKAQSMEIKTERVSARQENKENMDEYSCLSGKL